MMMTKKSSEEFPGIEKRTLCFRVARFDMHDHRLYVMERSGDLNKSCVCVAVSRDVNKLYEYGTLLGAGEWVYDNSGMQLFIAESEGVMHGNS